MVDDEKETYLGTRSANFSRQCGNSARLASQVRTYIEYWYFFQGCIRYEAGSLTNWLCV